MCLSFLRIFIRQDLFLFLYIIPINDKIVLGGIAMRRNDVGAILVIAVLYAGMQLVGITCPILSGISGWVPNSVVSSYSIST